VAKFPGLIVKISSFSLHLGLFLAALGCFISISLLFSASQSNRLIIKIETLSKKEVRSNSVSGWGIFVSGVD